MPPKAQRKTPAQARADAALDRVAAVSSTPTARALDFLLRGSHDEPIPPPEPSSTKISHATDASHAANARHAEDARHAKSQPQAVQIASHVSIASHAPVAQLNDQSSDLWSSVPEILRYVKVLHGVTDYLCRLLTPPEQVIYNQLYRLSWGFGKSQCRISLDKLAERANLSRRGAHDAVTKLIAKRLVVKQQQVLGKGKEQGTVFELPLPPKLAALLSNAGDARHAGDAYNKEHTLKDTHTNTETGARVGSRFDLQECRRYAEHLRSSGQGINNPGGYATKIHRSGEADELIAAFLAPVEAVPNVDVGKCPDCRGTGFWEPGGAGKGVAKCKHERLLTS